MYLFSFLEIPLVVPKTKKECVKPEEKKGQIYKNQLKNTF
jgi:hypothetical protein